MDRAAIEDEKLSLFRGSHAMAVPVTDRGYVRMGDGRLRLIREALLSEEEKVLADAPLSDVRYWEPRVFMGDGVKVGMGDAGDWTVEPAKNGLFALKHAKGWTSQFIEALKEAGAQPAD